MCCCFSLETGYQLVGILCCTVSLMGLSMVLYGFQVTNDLNRLFGSGLFIAYGVPAYYWLRSETKADKKKNQTRFIKTYVWLTGIWWSLVFLFFGLIVLVMSGFGMGDGVSTA